MKKEMTTPQNDTMLYIIQIYEAEENENIDCICDVAEEKINEESLMYSFETEKNRKEVMDEMDKMENIHYRTTEVPQSEWEKHYHQKQS